MKPVVDVHIEELVLHGLDPAHRHRIAAAVQQELAHLLAGQGLPRPLLRSADLADLDAGAFNVRPGASPGALGARVSRAIYHGLGGLEP